MTEEQFENNYPREKFNYVHKSSKTRGPMGETEIDVYEIISKETGDLVLTATRTEHTQIRGLTTTTKWDW